MTKPRELTRRSGVLQIGRMGLTLVALIGLLYGLRWLGAGAPGIVGGRAEVIDGDSLRVGGEEIRLLGIDAPEGRQTCQRGSAPWPCGKEARAALERLVRQGDVHCRSEGRDQHGRLLAVCTVGAVNVNAELVALGFAVASGRGVTAAYRDEERTAKDGRRGIWQGEFTTPREWRRQNGIGR